MKKWKMSCKEYVSNRAAFTTIIVATLTYNYTLHKVWCKSALNTNFAEQLLEWKHFTPKIINK